MSERNNNGPNTKGKLKIKNKIEIDINDNEYQNKAEENLGFESDEVDIEQKINNFNINKLPRSPKESQ